jgi:hypothetical protein
LGQGKDAYAKALEYVKVQRVVVVGATSKDYGQHEGHVAILLPKFGVNHHAPLVYCGSYGSAQSPGTKTIRDVWSPSKHGVVRFFTARRGWLDTNNRSRAGPL